MFYLIAQILLCLLAAFVLGAIVTWVIMRGGRDRKTAANKAGAFSNTSELETELAAAQQAMERYRNRGDALEQELEALRESMEHAGTGERSGRGDAMRLKDLEAQLARSRAEASKAADAAKNAAARAGELDALVNSQKGKLVSLQEEVEALAELRREVESTKAALGQRDADMRNHESRVEALTTELSNARQECEDELHRKDDEIARLRLTHAERKERPTPKPRTKPAAKSTGPDDLKRIKGIGVVLERALHKNGIRTLQEIADWSNEDIERVDKKLENFKGRIRRDDWVSQAKTLCKND